MRTIVGVHSKIVQMMFASRNGWAEMLEQTGRTPFIRLMQKPVNVSQDVGKNVFWGL
jgi:hypothetical protein